MGEASVMAWERSGRCSSPWMRVQSGAPRCRRSSPSDESSPIARNGMRGGLEVFFAFLSPKCRIGGRMGDGLELLQPAWVQLLIIPSFCPSKAQKPAATPPTRSAISYRLSDRNLCILNGLSRLSLINEAYVSLINLPCILK